MLMGKSGGEKKTERGRRGKRRKIEGTVVVMVGEE